MTPDERERLAKAIELRIGGLEAYVEESRRQGTTERAITRQEGIIEGYHGVAKLVREWPAEDLEPPGNPRNSPAYRVEFKQEISFSNVHLCRSRTLDMPLAPALKMAMDGLFWEDDDCSTIEFIFYNCQTGLIECQIEEDKSLDSFSVEDAKECIAYGCFIDGLDDPQEWARQARLDGHVIPEGEPRTPDQ